MRCEVLTQVSVEKSFPLKRFDLPGMVELCGFSKKSRGIS